MDYEIIEEDTIRASRTVRNDLPSEFTRGDIHDLCRAIREEEDFWPEEMDPILDNHDIEIIAFNIIRTRTRRLIAIILETDNVREELMRMDIKDYKVEERKERATCWI